MQLFVNTSTDPALNLAVEELLASSIDSEVCMLWRNAPAIIVGCNQNTEAEINADFVHKNNISVVRRITGGGAVYHDLGNINYTIVANDRQLEPEAFARNAEVILQTLRSFGVDAQFSGRNDIIADGRKISGSAKTVLTRRTLFHGTLLFETDLSILEKALNVDEEKILSKGIKSVRSRVANIREFLPDWTTDDFLSQLQHSLLKQFNQEQVLNIPEKLLTEANELADSKYRTWEWNFGSRHKYSYNYGKRFACGTVRVSFDIENDKITGLLFHGDFFGKRSVTELAEKLCGLPPPFTPATAVFPADFSFPFHRVTSRSPSVATAPRTISKSVMTVMKPDSSSRLKP